MKKALVNILLLYRKPETTWKPAENINLEGALKNYSNIFSIRFTPTYLSVF